MTLYDSELSEGEILEAYGGDQAAVVRDIEHFEYVEAFEQFGTDAIFFAEVRRRRVAQERANAQPGDNGEVEF